MIYGNGRFISSATSYNPDGKGLLPPWLRDLEEREREEPTHEEVEEFFRGLVELYNIEKVWRANKPTCPTCLLTEG